MCGIAGFVGHSATGVRERLERMSGALVHRGPDDGGLLVDRGSGLAMRRLSIVGIETGAQPILSEDATVAIVGNGEIYNAPELRAELEARGHRFRGGSDIEVALHLFEELGEELLGRLNGMFALAILERPSGRILVARDRLGIKPLFHATTAAGTLFASEIPALRRGLEPSESALLEADPLALRDFLSLGYVPSPRTMHRGIRRLPPGHRMWITPGGAEPDCWWNLPDFTPEERSVDGWAEEAAELIADAVRLRTMGDVPAGAFLSGGLDSGTVVGLLARQVGGPVPAFTLAFDDPRLDELEDARRTARHFGLEHHVETLSGVRFEEVEALLGSFGEPFADVSLLPTHRVSRLAAERVKFVISGDGGDELFGGYPWLHREARMRALPGAVLAASRCLGPLLRATQSSVGAGFLGKALRLAGDLASDSASAFIRRRSLCPPGRLRSLLHPRIRAEWRALPPSTLERHAARWSGEPLELLLDLDRRHYLAGDILEKVDRASMMHSLEVRVPLLDHRLVELAARIPIEVHLGPRHRGKTVLRRACERLLPPELLERPKRGFGMPVDRWLRDDMAEPLRERLLDRGFLKTELIDEAALRRLLAEHRSGHARHGHLLWGLLSLALWASEQPGAKLLDSRAAKPKPTVSTP